MSALGFTVGPFQFDQPIWLVLLPIGWGLAIWIGRSSLSGMGTTVRRVALVVRLLVIMLLVAAIARPHWRREAKAVTLTGIVDESKSMGGESREKVEALVDARKEKAKRDDRVAYIVTAESSYVTMLPGRPGDAPSTAFYGAREGTDLAGAIQLALAAMDSETANRILLFTDGVETAGSIIQAAMAAKAVGVPIDVLPYRYRHDREIIVESLAVPATARKGENVNLNVLIDSRQQTTGRLSLSVGGEFLDLDPDTESVGLPIDVDVGLRQFKIPITLAMAGPQTFEAVFEPDDPTADSIPDNNRALGVTFVSSEGRVLVIAEDPDEANAFMRVMEESRLEADLVTPDMVPSDIVTLSSYDGIVMLNTSAAAFSQRQLEDMRSYVHDLGGGLVMIGGPESFGMGAWIDTPLADALPVKLDPPQKRQMPRGALVLIMHSCEMPRGNYWGTQTALAAVNNLSRLDLAGVVEYSWQQGGDIFIHPLSQLGNKAAIRRAINSLSFGDAPSFGTMMQIALKGTTNSPGLEDVNAGAKHVIVISDGDPSPPTKSLLNQYIKNNVSISTVAVFPHMGGANSPDVKRMENIAIATGGRHYTVTTGQQLKELPNIFIKEAQTIRRNMLEEGEIEPRITNTAIPTLRGISGLPMLRGYVVTGEREGLAQTLIRGKEDDPILAVWQYGLGKSVAFTSDATTRWARDWVNWGQFKAFWEQHVRWAMRPGGSAEVRVTTQNDGPRTKLVVEALDDKGERLNFVNWRGRVVRPDGSTEDIKLQMTGAGRYEGDIDSAQAGAYVLSLRYAASDSDGERIEGTVQAAVTRPFADEFRALQDNSGLLTQVAEITGGRVIDEIDPGVNLWEREGLTMPVATQPIWLWAALFGIGMFLFDVGVRRVRIDPLAMLLFVRRGMERSKETAGGQLSSLKAARERAQEGIAERAKTDDDRRKSKDKSERGVKFEASEDELAASEQNMAIPSADEAERSRSVRRKQTEQSGDDEEGMSRLMRAKRRARDQMGGEEDDR